MMVRKRNAPSGPVMTRPRYRKPTLSYSPFSSACQRSTDIPVAHVCGVHQLRFPAREQEAQYLQRLRCYTGASEAESGCRGLLAQSHKVRSFSAKGRYEHEGPKCDRQGTEQVMRLASVAGCQPAEPIALVVALKPVFVL
jgi:hypothetical protein